MITTWCQQNSDEWAQQRRGIPTASELDNLITPLGAVRSSEGRDKYVVRKMAERLVGYSAQEGGASSFFMDQGLLLERYARPWFEFETNTLTEQPGFISTDDKRFGCSPDGLIKGQECGLEIKSPDIHTHLGYLLAGDVPKEYIAQVQGSMFATGWNWWWFVSFHQTLPKLCIKVARDDVFQHRIAEALDKFWKDMDAGLAKLEPLMGRKNDQKPTPAAAGKVA